MKDAPLTLAEVAEAAGIPARTVRFYIARGLLDGPDKGGRSAAYSSDHVARLERIKRFQAAGRTLSEIARLLHAPSPKEHPAAAATAWWQYPVADDVMVWVKAGASPWRTRQVSAAVDEFARSVRPSKDEKSET